jgi:translation initiation factor IF-2
VWFWIPTSRWAPAYVSWGYANDYVSWCPLGWNNRAVISINIFGGSSYYYAGPRYYSAWTIVPRGYFGRGYAYERAVSWDRFRNERPRFVEGRAPGGYDRAVPRNTAPIRYAGTREPAAVAGRPGMSTTPRYINRGDQIVRSQTGRPIAPRDSVAPRATPNSAPASREGRAWDNPAYRPPKYSPASPRSGAYQRTVPQNTPPVRGFERPGDRAVPGFQTPPAGRPFERGYERTMPRETGQTEPRAVERVYPRQGGAYQRPDAGVYQRPGAADPRPGEGAYPRQSERPGGGAFQRPGGGYERPAERSAPPQRSGGERPGGGDRATPRSGGGHVNAPAGAPAGNASRGGRRSR